MVCPARRSDSNGDWKNQRLPQFNIWTINGQPYDQSEPIKIEQGRRYRLAFVNKSDDMHPLHLHRHNFEITKIHGKETSGIFKDTVLVKGFVGWTSTFWPITRD